ncbi:MAG: hypothetical protein WCP55_02055 [Lentisphaerota bacterium]
MKFDKLCNGYMEALSKADAEIVTEEKGLTSGQPKDQIEEYKGKDKPSKGEGAKSEVNPKDGQGYTMEGGDMVCSGDCFKKYAEAHGEATAGKPEDTLEMYKKINAKWKIFPKAKCGVCGTEPAKVDITK